MILDNDNRNDHRESSHIAIVCDTSIVDSVAIDVHSDNNNILIAASTVDDVAAAASILSLARKVEIRVGTNAKHEDKITSGGEKDTDITCDRHNDSNTRSCRVHVRINSDRANITEANITENHNDSNSRTCDRRNDSNTRNCNTESDHIGSSYSYNNSNSHKIESKNESERDIYRITDSAHHTIGGPPSNSENHARNMNTSVGNTVDNNNGSYVDLREGNVDYIQYCGSHVDLREIDNAETDQICGEELNELIEKSIISDAQNIDITQYTSLISEGERESNATDNRNIVRQRCVKSDDDTVCDDRKERPVNLNRTENEMRDGKVAVQPLSEFRTIENRLSEIKYVLSKAIDRMDWACTASMFQHKRDYATKHVGKCKRKKYIFNQRNTLSSEKCHVLLSETIQKEMEGTHIITQNNISSGESESKIDSQSRVTGTDDTVKNTDDIEWLDDNLDEIGETFEESPNEMLKEEIDERTEKLITSNVDKIVLLKILQSDRPPIRIDRSDIENKCTVEEFVPSEKTEKRDELIVRVTKNDDEAACRHTHLTTKSENNPEREQMLRGDSPVAKHTVERGLNDTESVLFVGWNDNESCDHYRHPPGLNDVKTEDTESVSFGGWNGNKSCDGYRHPPDLNDAKIIDTEGVSFGGCNYNSSYDRHRHPPEQQTERQSDRVIYDERVNEKVVTGRSDMDFIRKHNPPDGVPTENEPINITDEMINDCFNHIEGMIEMINNCCSNIERTSVGVNELINCCSNIEHTSVGVNELILNRRKNELILNQRVNELILNQHENESFSKSREYEHLNNRYVCCDVKIKYNSRDTCELNGIDTDNSENEFFDRDKEKNLNVIDVFDAVDINVLNERKKKKCMYRSENEARKDKLPVFNEMDDIVCCFIPKRISMHTTSESDGVSRNEMQTENSAIYANSCVSMKNFDTVAQFSSLTCEGVEIMYRSFTANEENKLINGTDRDNTVKQKYSQQQTSMLTLLERKKVHKNQSKSRNECYIVNKKRNDRQNTFIGVLVRMDTIMTNEIVRQVWQPDEDDRLRQINKRLFKTLNAQLGSRMLNARLGADAVAEA